MGFFRKKDKEKVMGRAKSGAAGNLEQASPIVKSIIEQVKCPYRILEGLTPEELMKTYVDAYLKGRLGGYVPVLVPEDSVLEETLEYMKEDGYNPDMALKEAADMEGSAVLEGYLEDAGEDVNGEFLGAGDDAEANLGGGEVEGIDLFSSLEDFGTGRQKTVIMFEVPTQNPWETVAYVPFGGWNECPAPAEMAAVCKYWFEQYQAVPAVISHDTLEFLLPKPIPAERAMEVAREHFAFCTDRVYQGTATGTLREVADCLALSKVWFFWWD